MELISLFPSYHQNPTAILLREPLLSIPITSDLSLSFYKSPFFIYMFGFLLAMTTTTTTTGTNNNTTYKCLQNLFELAERRLSNGNSGALKCRSSPSSSDDETTKPTPLSLHQEGRRALVASLLSTG
jgi:hypothetical protein